MTISSNKWLIVLLGTIAEFRNGINYNKDNFGRGIKVINVRNFQNYSFANFADLDEVNLAKSVRKDDLLQDDDILFVRSNGNRELIGRSLFICNVKEPITHSAFTIKVRFTSEKALPKFYSYVFRSSLIRQTLSAQGSGTNISNLNQAILANLQVPMPPIDTQRKIADILSAYDRLIENNTRRIKILEEMTQLLYREWFVNFRFPGYEKVSMVESELGLIPQGWEIVKLGSIAGINSSSIKTSNAPIEISYVDIASVSTGQIDKIELLAFLDAPSRARRIVQHGDVIWSTVRPNRRSYSLILHPPSNLIVSTGFAVIAAKKVPYTYLYQSLITDDFVGYLTNNATGAAYPAVNSNDFKNANILLPTKELVERYHTITLDMLNQIHTLQQKSNNLRKTRDLLLPKLISGEIDVEAIDSSDIESCLSLEEIAA